MKQNIGLNALKVLMILFVIFIHENPSLEKNGEVVMWWHSVVVVAVPVFFTLSGYFFFKNVRDFTFSNYKQKLKKRAKTLLFPYVIWNCFPVLFVVVGNLYSIIFRHKNTTDLFAFLQGLWDEGLWHIWWDKTSEMMPFDSPLWYVRDLMILCVCSPLIYYAIKYLQWGVVLVFMGLYIAGISFPIGLSLTGFLFFSLGATFALKGLPLALPMVGGAKITYYAVTLIAFLLCNMLKVWWIHAVFILTSCYAWVLLFHDLKGKWAEHIAQYSDAVFFVLALHNIIVLANVGKMTEKLFTGNLHLICYWIVPFITLVICVVLYVTLRKFFPKMTALLCGGR